MTDLEKLKEGGITVNVLFRFSKKTGKIDTTMVGLGTAMMELWAMQNTTKTKGTVIVERETGKVLFIAEGTPNGFPKIRKASREDLGTCEEYGMPLEAVQSIKDDRFDKEEVQA